MFRKWWFDSNEDILCLSSLGIMAVGKLGLSSVIVAFCEPFLSLGYEDKAAACSESPS